MLEIIHLNEFPIPNLINQFRTSHRRIIIRPVVGQVHVSICPFLVYHRCTVLPGSFFWIDFRPGVNLEEQRYCAARGYFCWIWLSTQVFWLPIVTTQPFPSAKSARNKEENIYPESVNN